MGNCTSSGGSKGSGANRGGETPTVTSNAALSTTQDSIVSRMREASANDDRQAYREAAADFARSLNVGEKVTEYVTQDNKYAKGGTILSTIPTVWVKNRDGTISSMRNTSTKYTAEEWARKRWRDSMGNATFLKGSLTPQQIADALKKMGKGYYSVKEQKK